MLTLPELEAMLRASKENKKQAQTNLNTMSWFPESCQS